MHFNIGAFTLNQFVLLFAAAFLGLAFGKIKIGKFSFGLSGTLFSGLLLGWAAVAFARGIGEGDALYKTAQKVVTGGIISKDFFDFFLILFITAVGLLTGKDIARALKKYGLKFLIIGFVITFTGVAATYGFIVSSDKYSAYQVSGIYTGALTSSPGLAASLETVKNQADSVEARYQQLSNEDKTKVLKMVDKSGALTPENTPELSKEQIDKFIKTAQSDVSLGHTLAFPFGLLTIILSVVFLPKLFRIDVDKEREEFAAGMQKEAEGMKEAAVTSEKSENIKEGKFNLIAFAFVCFLGYFLGSFKFSLGAGEFSLGTSGGVLVAALTCSHFGKIGPLNFRMDSKTLGVVRQIGLGFFLSTVGLMYGYDAVSVFGGSGAAVAMMGLVVVVVSILMGFIVGRYVFKLNWMVLAGAICGGMTSTPGLGAATDAVGSDYPAIGYGATYPFALIYKVVLLMILHKLFII
ncbi:putative transport protein [Clostridium saccharoperbutylacetonicum]|uniref:Putative permease n=1 Tax=Clostridium saccharoperbutylacetonicum N1-4(HMT) TaxID=931276 RepID=M1LWC8_9CLOT|nr:permease [Clostridium saccharoperbutylacetonicum]AGF57495.1 putative permease [Clostridium saccharoperbutylacetonicum N1-4(HMT)]NRT61737.1 putative transport protein [Clostridium saccharoperbutylacetonicum]NSB25062.1 putative transport protein [Clostridium saccharoperbutylacetonicum]NSB44431.1 putative transport protein [Clostridium saccharoperbutylacetonicum]